MPMFSIVIPLYNKESTIVNTLKSILVQTVDDFEIVIVDDGSTDDSVKEVASFRDERIRIISQENAGVSAARNRGIFESRGEYIALLDADDIWECDFLQEVMALIAKYPECSVFAVSYIFRDEHKNTVPIIVNRLPFKGNDGILNNYFEVASHSNPPICSSSVVVRKKALEEVGGFPIGIKTGEDLLVWAKLACKYKIAFSKSGKAYYELPSGGTLRPDPKDMSLKNDTVRKELLSILREYKPKGWRQYMSFWDKMRAVINYRKSDRGETFRYAIRSVMYNPLNYKSVALLFLSLLPMKLAKSFVK